jgi:hypothetical protein
MKMKKIYILIVSFFCISILSAQTGIGTSTPNASAKLDVSSSNKGFLPPRISLTDIYDQTTIPSPATGLLVYCKGDAGLAAGYYYWNGNAWATIATAGGSGSFAASFLRGSRSSSQSVAKDGIVSFSTVDNSAGQDISLNTTNGKITLAPGNTYRLIAAVPTFTSGQRPSFMWYNETTTTYIGSASSTYNTGDAASYGAFGVIAHVIITPSVSTVLSFRMLSSLSNGSVTVGGNSDFSTNGSYPWFEAQVISGNAPITGQSVDYGIVRYTGADGSALIAGALVGFDATASGNLVWSGNKFTLKANKTYELESSVSIHNSSAGSAGIFQIFDYTNSISLANSLFMSQNGTGSKNQNANTPIKCIVTPTTDIQVGIKLSDYYGGAPGIIGNAVATGSTSASNTSYFMVKQIGSSAIVNPWVLSGNDVYNTSGEVGIGTSSPSASALLDVTSTNKGILIPRMTASQKNAISSPTTGLLIFQTDAPVGFYYYNGSSWISISNPGTTTRYLPHSSNFTHLSAGQSLTSLASGSGSYVAIGSSDLVIDVPSGYSSNKVVIKWDTWGDVSASSAAHGSFRYQIKQTGTSTATYGSAAMNGWAVTGSSAAATRFATPVTYILTDLAPGTYTFKLEISREAEVGTITNMNNYHVSGSVQVFVK